MNVLIFMSINIKTESEAEIVGPAPVCGESEGEEETAADVLFQAEFLINPAFAKFFAADVTAEVEKERGRFQYEFVGHADSGFEDLRRSVGDILQLQDLLVGLVVNQVEANADLAHPRDAFHHVEPDVVNRPVPAVTHVFVDVFQ